MATLVGLRVLQQFDDWPDAGRVAVSFCPMGAVAGYKAKAHSHMHTPHMRTCTRTHAHTYARARAPHTQNDVNISTLHIKDHHLPRIQPLPP